MKALFLHELRQNIRTTVIWILSLTGGAGLYMSVYPVFSGAMVQINKVLAGFPPVLRKAMGITFDSHFMLGSFFALILGYITLAAAIQAMNLGTALTSKEERGKTAEFLLAKPINRSAIVTAKLSVAALMILATNLVFTVSMRIIMAMNSKTSLDLKVFLMMAATMLFVQIFFLAFGFLLSVSMKRIKSVLSVSLVSVFGFYIVGMLDAVLGAKAVRYLTPFKFYDLIYVVKNSAYQWQYPVLEVVLVVTAIAAGYVIYERRNISSI
jgi:ABC-2 type transport system permease protein